MFIENCVESYSNVATQNLKDNYLKDNLEITRDREQCIL